MVIHSHQSPMLAARVLAAKVTFSHPCWVSNWVPLIVEPACSPMSCFVLFSNQHNSNLSYAHSHWIFQVYFQCDSNSLVISFQPQFFFRKFPLSIQITTLKTEPDHTDEGSSLPHVHVLYFLWYSGTVVLALQLFCTLKICTTYEEALD